MPQLEVTTGEVIARAVLAHAERGAFGVLVQEMPEFEPRALLEGLSRGARASLRISMPGYPPAVSKLLKDTARRLGLQEDWFGTTVEGAERWRNDRAVTETIVVVAPREIPKLSSLKRFHVLTGGELYRQVCTEGHDRFGVNEAQRQLWRAFQHKSVGRTLPLEGLLAYFAELSGCTEREIPTRSRELLYLLGLLPDPDLFTHPTAAKIAQRLLENQRVVDQLEVLSRTDRQRISRALGDRAGTRASGALQDTYQKAMAFYREQDPARLKDLSLRDVQRLFRAKSEPVTADEPGAERASPDEPRESAPETRPTVRALDLLLDGDDAGLERLGDAIRSAINADADEEDASEARDPETGAVLEVRRTHPFLRVVERFVGQDRWGGVVETSGVTLDESLALLDKAEPILFDPDGPEWDLRRTLARMVEDVGLDPALVAAYDAMRESRRVLAAEIKPLLIDPCVQLNSSREFFAQAERYLAAYKALTEGLKRAYESIAEVAPEGVEVLCSQVLALDTIVLRSAAGLKAVLSPLHPLHLWKYVELSRQIRVQAGALSEAEKELLRARITELPNFVTTLYLSNYITGAGPKVLPEAGSRGGVPYFEELAHQYAGRDGFAELTRVTEKFCALYPHARMGLRVVFIDPPDIEFLLKEMVKISDGAPLEIDGVHVRLYFTSRHDASVNALGGGAEDEDGAERFRGAGAGSRFTLEVNDAPMTLQQVAQELQARPAHIAVYFDPSTAKTRRFARSPSLTVHPLCLPMQFSYDVITHVVRVIPAADGGIFTDHNDLRDRLSHNLTGSFYGVTAELKAEQRVLASLAGGCTWFVVADRAQEGALSFGVPRVALYRCAKRDLAVYATGLSKFVGEFDRQLRRANYTPDARAVERMIQDLGGLLSDGLLALVTATPGGPALDERRTQGLVGTLVTSSWFRARYPRSLLVSIDSVEARRWLELVDDRTRADLFGVVEEPDGSITIDLMEVKTYEAPDRAYRVNGGEVSGDAIGQLLNTARIVDEIFELDPTRERIVAPQRREVLRQQLFRECFFEGRSDDEKQLWSARLNAVFALECKLRVRLSLVVVGLTQAHESTERVLRADGREVHVVELTEEEVRRQVSAGAPPVIRPPPPPGGRPPGGARGGDAPSQPSPPGAASASGSPPPAGPAASGSPPSQPVSTSATSAPVERSASAPTTGSASTPDEGERAHIARLAGDLKRILRDHGAPVQELEPDRAQVGPSVIRFRVRLKAGAKVSALRSRAEDIGRELAARTVPFIDNIAGENYVGIDLERPRREVVALMPAIDALPAARGLQLPVAVGVSPAGEHVHLDLVQLPHLLVAGSTMSGKTVFLHAVLLSLIARLSPDQLELLIIDPKATDFVQYNGLPYLRGGRVFTEAEDAIEQLRGLTDEELRSRTRALQQARCPNLAEYNAANPEEAIRPIVVVIDEYADLMAVLSKRDRQEFEKEINRLAQRARSVGIHLVLATQRPTTDVVTGLLKANMPCRVSFRLPQRVDSQTILDQAGAENLFGRGDMLLLQNDRLTRLQGYYMSVADMTAFLATRYPGSGIPPVDEPESLDLAVDDSDEENRKSLEGVATALVVDAGSDDLGGGGTVRVEVELQRGDGGCEVIGSAGAVLQESAKAAWRYVQTHAKEYGVSAKGVSGKSAVVHLVEIAQRRDGPSGGIPFVVAMLSALTQRPVKPGIAMTGEVSLKGTVTAVGGIPQKVIAAYKRGRRLVILPKANQGDLAAVPREVREEIEFHFAENVHDVIEKALGA